MTGDQFVYVTFIRTSAQKLWDALREPEFTRQYWAGTWQDCSWEVGSSWKLMFPDGRVCDSGEVLEIDPPRKLVLSWRKECIPEMHAEGYSRLTYLLEPQDDCVKLTIKQEIDHEKSKLIEALSNGWPSFLSSLKTLLETGESLPHTRELPNGT